MTPKVGIAIVVVAALLMIIVLISAGNFQGFFTATGTKNEANTANGSPGDISVRIITVSGGSLVPNATYSISSAPPSKLGAEFIIRDGGKGDAEPSPGVITVAGFNDGNLTITQENVPQQFQLNNAPKMLTLLGNSNTTVVIENAAAKASQQAQSSDSLQSIVYTSKFECGTISGSEGPLRPGHYDTDISIFNKQDFAVKLFISANVNKQKSSNTILQTLAPRTSSGIVCKDLQQLFGSSAAFTEGFVSIEVPRDPRLLGELSDNGAVVVGQQSAQLDLLDVQVFYTANALDTLPHSVYADKITFRILNDTSSKIPKDMLLKTLDITLPSDIGLISDPELQVKQSLADKFGLTSDEQKALRLTIDSIGVGVGTMVDDHAISLSHVLPESGN